MFSWVRQLLVDPTGSHSAALVALDVQSSRSTKLQKKLEGIADQLRNAREAVCEKAAAVEEEIHGPQSIR